MGKKKKYHNNNSDDDDDDDDEKVQSMRRWYSGMRIVYPSIQITAQNERLRQRTWPVAWISWQRF